MAEGPGQRFPSPPKTEDAGVRSAGRPEYESVDLEDVEEVPLSVDEISAIDIDIEEDNVDKILAMTGENWSIDAQRETLKEAAKDPATRTSGTEGSLRRPPA